MCCLQSSAHLLFVRHVGFFREDRCFKFEKQSKGLDERLLQAVRSKRSRSRKVAAKNRQSEGHKGARA